jgi:hypothetical protein
VFDEMPKRIDVAFPLLSMTKRIIPALKLIYKVKNVSLLEIIPGSTIL